VVGVVVVLCLVAVCLCGVCAQSVRRQGGCWLLRQAKAWGEKKQEGEVNDDLLLCWLFRSGVRRASLPVMTMLMVVVFRVYEVCARAQVVAHHKTMHDVGRLIASFSSKTPKPPHPPFLFTSFFLFNASIASRTSGKQGITQAVEAVVRDITLFAVQHVKEPQNKRNRTRKARD